MKNSAFINQLIYERKRRDLSQDAVGKALDYTQQAVGKWESGLSSPDPDTISRLADFFGISTDTLLAHKIVKESTVPYRTKSDFFNDFIHSQTLREAYELEDVSEDYLRSLATQLENYLELLVSTTNKKD